jgi:hypothetical protein
MPTSLQLFLAIDERQINYLVHNTSFFIGKTKFKKEEEVIFGVFQLLLEVRVEKKKSKNHHIHIFGFHCVATNIEG